MSDNWESRLDQILTQDSEADEQNAQSREQIIQVSKSHAIKALDELTDKLSEHNLIAVPVNNSTALMQNLELILSKDQYYHFYFRVIIDIVDNKYSLTFDYAKRKEDSLTDLYSVSVDLDKPEEIKRAIRNAFIECYETYKSDNTLQIKKWPSN